MARSRRLPPRSFLAALAVLAMAMSVVVAFVAGPAAASTAQDRGAAVVRGQVRSGDVPLSAAEVRLWEVPMSSTRARAQQVGADTARADGSFRISWPSSRPAGAVYYLTADHGPRAEMAAVLSAAAPERVVLNELTTVAAAYAFAQLLDGDVVTGVDPGPVNAASMAANLADTRTGTPSTVLTTSPNGWETSTQREFNSLANALVPCFRDSSRCGSLIDVTTPPGGPSPRTTFDAVASIARHPSNNARQIYALAAASEQVYRPTLGARNAPDSWTLALRFDGDGSSLNGPGNFAIDARGDVWVTANYTYSRNPFAPVCGSKQLFVFTPDGRYTPGSPYTGGGLDGAGFGITFDPAGHVWVGNFGFAADRCTTQPPHNSVSEFTASGQPLSPSATATSGGGFTQGGVSWPQGVVSDAAGTIRIANCGNDTLTTYPSGDPAAATSAAAGVSKPFDLALNGKGQTFVTGNGDNAVAVLNGDGTAARTPITGGGLDHPLGIAADTHGNMWVADSGAVTIPCPDGGIGLSPRAGGITYIAGDGGSAPTRFTGGGVTVPWGIAVDGHDHVWVANFAGQRLSEFCGVDTSTCPPGMRTGGAISPSDGYRFDGLTRNTGVAIDPSGNVWVANNWKNLPLPTLNPGAYQVVTFIGAGAPIQTPLIGPPHPLPSGP